MSNGDCQGYFIRDLPAAPAFSLNQAFALEDDVGPNSLYVTGQQIQSYFDTRYLQAEVNDLTAAVTWANVPDANITESSVTQHTGAIDHNSLLNYAANEHASPKNSIEIDTGQLQLSGDSASPGNSKLYGTNGVGIKGWYDQPTGGGSGEANTASNLGAGIGVFDGKVGVDLQFRSLVSQNTLLGISLDGPNSEVDFTVNEANINHNNLTNAHNLTTDIDHNSLLNYVAAEHFTEASINHVNIQNIGTNTHAQIDTHIADSTIHFTKSSINIGDLGDVDNTAPANRHVFVYDGVTDNRYENRLLVEADISDLQAYLTTEVNDLTAAVTWADVPDTNITQSSVVQHEAALTVTESQISDLGPYAGNPLTSNLDVGSSSIVSAASLDINILPGGAGNVSLGNYKFDADQAVGVGQDNYVLTYENATGLISLKESSGGGGGDFVQWDPVTGRAFNIATGSRILIGDATTGAAITATDAILIGQRAGEDLTGGTGVVGVGTDALAENVTGINLTALGHEAGKGVAGNSHSNSTYLGYRVGSGTTTGSGRIMLGANIGTSAIPGSVSNILAIDNSDVDADSAIIYADMNAHDIRLNARVRIGASGLTTGDPRSPLDVIQPLAGGATPVLFIEQADVNAAFLSYYGQSAPGSVTNHIVSETAVTTAVRVGFLAASVLDLGGQIIPGNYYMPIFNLA